MTFEAAGAAWFVLETSVRALAAAAAVAMVLRLLRVHSAAARHSAWTAVLFAMLLMPLLLSIVPPLTVPVPAAAGELLGVGIGTREGSAAIAAPRIQPRGSSDALRTPATPGSVALPDPPTRPVPPSRSSFGMVALAIYAGGVLLLLARLLYGWFIACGMIARARARGPIALDVAGQLYESPDVTVPMTVGVVRPVVILPAAWRTWDPQMLAAIVAHESAHVRRRDTAINFAAQVNRAVFWFHPLAWWLERTLAVTAEHACDDAAARAIGAPRRYAEILVSMADLVRRSRGRFAWQGVGVDGAGLLDRRIDRLVGGDAVAAMSRMNKLGAVVGCTLAIALVVACRQQASVTPLREDPELARTLAARTAQTKRFEAARDMPQEQAEALEQRLAGNPDDFDARWQLVTYYRASSKVAWDKKVPGLRRHALWLIEHHPEHDVAAPVLSPEHDPDGFAAAKKLWQAHLTRPNVSAFLVYRAASFFAPHNKPFAELLIMRGMKMDPESAALAARMPPDAGGYQWPAQLSSLYASALLGSESAWGTYNDLRTHAERINSSYAQEVERKLEATADAGLLARVGSILTRPLPPSKDPAMKQAMDRTHALGIRHLERALELDPNLEGAKAALVRLRLPGTLTEADRLASAALQRYTVAEDITEYVKKDLAAGKQQRDEAAARAEQVLKMANPPEPKHSAAVMTAHHVLAIAALRDGDRERAVHHLRESVKVPPSEQIRYALPFSWGRPVNRLLKAGERESVAEFLEALARLSITERDRLLRDAQAIRDGRMTSSYQSMVAREGE